MSRKFIVPAAARTGKPVLVSTHELIRVAMRSAALAAALLLAACGGGGETKTGSGGTGVFPASSDLVASGPLNSLGPTNIGGLALDDTAATIQINAAGALSNSELRLGMLAESAGTYTVGNSSGTVSTLTAESAVVGPVRTVDLAAQRLTVLTLSVQVNANTIFDGTPSLAALAPGTRVEIYGLPQSLANSPANSLLATRLVVLPPDNNAQVEILGTVTGLTTTQFNLQGAQVAAQNATLFIFGGPPLPNPIQSIGENARVRVVGSFNAATNVITATLVVGGLNPQRGDGSYLVLDGLVQSVGAAGHFRVNDTDVDATRLNVAGVAVGSQVRVRGSKQAGALLATELQVLSPADRIVYTVQGEVTDLVSLANFRVHGEKINAGVAQFSGAASLLANHTQVRIKAVAGPGQLTAMEVTLLQ